MDEMVGGTDTEEEGRAWRAASRVAERDTSMIEAFKAVERVQQESR